jgi:hypothetical protein
MLTATCAVLAVCIGTKIELSSIQLVQSSVVHCKNAEGGQLSRDTSLVHSMAAPASTSAALQYMPLRPLSNMQPCSLQ